MLDGDLTALLVDLVEPTRQAQAGGDVPIAGPSSAPHERRMKEHQTRLMLMLRNLGHEHHIVKSYKRFQEIVKDGQGV